MSTISITQSDLQTALRTLLLSVLPPGIEVVEGLDNRVPEPAGPDFVVMTVMGDERLSFNVDTYAPCEYTASIAGTIMTVSSVQSGTISPGIGVQGPGVSLGTLITGALTGTGGIGTYSISPAQNLSSSPLASGSITLQNDIKVQIQLDIHGPNSSDNTRIISTAFFDEYAFESFVSSGFAIAPLYMSEPRQVPYTNGEQQVEMRWTLDAFLQMQPIIGLTQFSATSVTLQVQDVAVQFPQ